MSRVLQCIILFFSVSYNAFCLGEKASVDYNGEERLNLETEWMFFWDTLLTNIPNEDTTIDYMKVPAIWEAFGFPTTGVATYFLKVNSDQDYSSLGLIVPEVHASYQLYINDELICANGKVVKDSLKCISQWNPKTVLVSLHKGANTFCLQVANYEHRRGGTYKPLVLGRAEKILDERELQVVIDVFLIGSLIAIALFFLGLFFFWRSDMSILFFSLTAISYALRTSLYDLHLLNKVLVDVPWFIMVKAEYISTYLTFLFWASLIKNLYPEDFHSVVHKVFTGLFLFCIGLVLFTSPFIFTAIMKFGLIIVFCLCLYSFYVFMRAFRFKRTGAAFTIAGLGMLMLVPILSMSFYFGWLPYIPFLENLSALWVTLSVSFVMALRFALSFKNAEDLKEKTEKQNEVILEALQEKELLVSEIHHRVKNNLQIINSLLMLQAKSIKDEESIKAFEESQFRIQTMAMVHQKLYQDSDSLSVDIRTYVSDLSNIILKSYSISDQIEVENDIDDIRLDIDTVISLGLIINELMTNSIKYAFDSIKSPKIVFEFKLFEKDLVFVYKDNGIGFKSQEVINQSFGLKLVKLLSKKMKSTPEFIHQENGVEIRFLIRKFKHSFNDQ